MKPLNLKKKLPIVALVAALALSGCSGSEDSAASDSESGLKTIQKGEIRIGAQSDNPPYSMIMAGGDEGYTTEIVKTIAERLNLEPKFSYMDFAALLPSVVSKNVDIAASSITATPEREKEVNFSAPTIFGPVSIVASKDSGITEDTDSLAGKRLGVIQGATTDIYATANWPDAKIVRFPDTNSTYSAVKSGTVDAVYGDQPLAAKTADENDNLELVTTFTNRDEPFAIAFNKNNPELRDAFDKEFASLIEDGTVEKLHVKYLPDVPVSDDFKPKK